MDDIEIDDNDLDPISDDSSLESDEDSMNFSGGGDSDSDEELDIDLSNYALSGAKNIFMLK